MLPRLPCPLRHATLLVFLLATAAHAFDQPATDKDWDPSVPQEQMMESLGQVVRGFGPYAVIMQSALLNEAVRNGSILEASVDAPQYRERDGRQYVVFSLASGIVYNDNSVSAEERLRRTWKDIVAAALRRLTEVQFEKAEGIAVEVGYHHRPYESEREVRENLPDGRGEAERASYYVALEDAAALAKGTADAAQVLPRTVVLRGGDVVELK
jgi:hypothetical protein